MLFFSVASLAGNEIGSLLRYPNIGAAVLFPPYAVLTSALVFSPRRDWIWYILLGSAAHLVTHWPQWSLSWVVLADVANIARALVAAGLLVWFLGSRPRLDSLQKLLTFFISVILIAPAVGAAIGAANVMLHQAATTFWDPWRAWFVSNALTGMTMMPAFLAVFAYLLGRGPLRVNRAHFGEAALLVLALTATCVIVFLGGIGRPPFPIALYGSLPVLIWAAVRFGAAGASVALTGITFAAVCSVDRGTGPFLAGSPDDNVLELQLFVLCTAVPVLCLAALAHARESVLQLYRALLASLRDQVAVVDANGILLESNDSWRSAATDTGTPSWHRVQPGDALTNACNAAAATDPAAGDVVAGMKSVLGGDSKRFELEYDSSHQGVLETYALTVEKLERDEGGAVVMRRDVTARRQAEMEIQTQRDQLSHLSRVTALGHLSAAFAHELHQPLAAIRLNGEIALTRIRKGTNDWASISAILEDMVADNQRAAVIVDRLRVLLKRGEVRFEEVDIKEVMADVLRVARADLAVRNVEVIVESPPTLPSVWGDRVQILQVLLNLVLNGCDAMTTSAEGVRRQLVMAAETSGSNEIHVRVRDYGTGIAPELLGELFKPFVTTKDDGLGLGLSISHSIVTAHGGRIWAENNTDVGATFHCFLPVKDDVRSHTLGRARPRST